MILRRAALLVLAIALTACAEAPPPASPPPAEAPPRAFEHGAKGAPSETDSEMMAISRAEDEIDRLFPRAAKGPAHKKAEEAKPLDRAPGKDDKHDAQGLAGNDPCATACRALSSMASSADHLCKLTGEVDGRCEDARGRVRGASGRVRSVCPGCAVGVK